MATALFACRDDCSADGLVSRMHQIGAGAVANPLAAQANSCYGIADFYFEEAVLAKRASSLSIEQLRKLASHGAAAAIQELEAEIYAIRKAFPELGQAARGAKAAGQRLRGRGRTMSAAARKAVSERMKKYWAARRAAKAKTKK